MLPIGTRLVWNCVVLVLLCTINSSFAQTTQDVSEKSEVAPRTFNMKLKDAYKSVLSFFRPVTCHHRGEKVLIPCHAGVSLNATQCLENKCCPSKTSHELKCYMPFKDNLQLAFRVLVIVAGGFLILGCLPFCCCAFLQRSQCFNPLRSANKKIKRIIKKKKEQDSDVHDPLLE